MGTVSEISDVSPRQTLNVLNASVTLAESMLAMANTQAQVDKMTAKVNEMRADRDQYAAQVARLESAKGQ